jgi:hypothetical protein
MAAIMIRKQTIATAEAKAAVTAIYKAQALTAFTNGLKKDARLAVIASRPKNLSEALEVAASSEVASGEATKPEEIYNFQNSSRGRGSQARDNTSNVTCFLCGKLGHVARSCFANRHYSNRGAPMNFRGGHRGQNQGFQGGHRGQNQGFQGGHRGQNRGFQGGHRGQNRGSQGGYRGNRQLTNRQNRGGHVFYTDGTGGNENNIGTNDNVNNNVGTNNDQAMGF